jgi:hypothetical protein
MFMTSYYTNLYLSKVNATAHGFFSVKQIMNFKSQTLSTFVFLFLTKINLLKVVHHLKNYLYTKFHGPTLNG